MKKKKKTDGIRCKRTRKKNREQDGQRGGRVVEMCSTWTSQEEVETPKEKD